MLRADIILRWVQGPAVLDVGCTGHEVEIGSPYWLHGRLHQHFSQVVGIDISSENVALLQRQGFTRVYVQSAEGFCFAQKFNTIVAGELIEHLANPGAFLSRSKEHLAAGGRLVITTPYPFSLLYILYALYKYPKTCQNTEHTCWFCPQTMKVLADRHGLKIEHFELIEDYRPDNPSRLYRSFVRLLKMFSPFVPERLSKNTILFVLVPDEDSTGS